MSFLFMVVPYVTSTKKIIKRMHSITVIKVIGNTEANRNSRGIPFHYSAPEAASGQRQSLTRDLAVAAGSFYLRIFS